MIDRTAFRITDNCINRAPSFRLIMIVQKLIGQLRCILFSEGPEATALDVVAPDDVTAAARHGARRRSLYEIFI